MNPQALLLALADERVDYVLVGGLAGSIRGTTRVTKDIDIAYSSHAANLERLCAVLNRFSPRRLILGQPEDDALTLTPDALRREPVLQLATSVGQIDLLNKIEGFATYGTIKKYAEVEDVGVEAPVLSIEGLIKAKEAMKRPKDVQDLIELRALAEAMRLTSPDEIDIGGSLKVKPSL